LDAYVICAKRRTARARRRLARTRQRFIEILAESLLFEVLIFFVAGFRTEEGA